VHVLQLSGHHVRRGLEASERAAEHRGEEAGGAEVRQVPLGGQELDGGVAAEVGLEVGGDDGRDGDMCLLLMFVSYFSHMMLMCLCLICWHRSWLPAPCISSAIY
jgi:hypothetical protein